MNAWLIRLWRAVTALIDAKGYWAIAIEPDRRLNKWLGIGADLLNLSCGVLRLGRGGWPVIARTVASGCNLLNRYYRALKLVLKMGCLGWSAVCEWPELGLDSWNHCCGIFEIGY